MRILQFIVVCSMAVPASAREFAVLANGSRLPADRHEIEGSVVRLYSEGGVMQMAAELVTGFEVEEAAPVPVAPLAALPAPVASSVPQQPQTPRDLAASAARKYGLPVSFVESVMKAESGFRASAVSSKGAIGLMQLMPGTARTLGVDPLSPRENAEGGAQYLRELLAKYEDSPDQVLLALAAYNAGPGAVEHYRGVPPYRETREYILRILKAWDRQQPAPERAK